MTTKIIMCEFHLTITTKQADRISSLFEFKEHLSGKLEDILIDYLEKLNVDFDEVHGILPKEITCIDEDE